MTLWQDLLNFLVAFDGAKLPGAPVKLSEPFVCGCGLLAALISIHSLWPPAPAAPPALKS